jgi:hypothetical protein
MRWVTQSSRAAVVVGVVMGVLATGPGTTVASSAVAAAPEATAATGHCDPVWFIGARGSGESSSGYNGMGKEIGYMAQAVAGDLQGKNLAMAYLPVNYPADSVDVLKPDSLVVNLLHDQDTAAAITEYIQSSVDPYDASMDEGITLTEDAVSAALGQCPNAKLILGGYSQGAVAVHDAENWLASNKPSELSHIAGTLLLGDPDRVPNTKAQPFGDSTGDAEGLRVYLHLVKAHDVPSPGSTANIANAGDMVGDFTGIPSIENAKADTAVHSSYATTVTGEKLLTAAATWVAAKIPGLSFTDTAIHLGSTAYGTVPAGQVTTRQLTATGGTAPYSYGIDSLDFSETPSWVALTAGGALTISPPAGTAGSYSFPVYATDHTGKTSKLATVTFTVASASGLLSWHAADVPYPAGVPSGSAGTLSGMACPTSSFCAAIGNYSVGGAGQLLTWSAGTWTDIQPPVPANVDPPYIDSASLDTGDVSCASASFCAAAGEYLNDAGDWDTMLATWSGKSWTSVEAPRPASASSVSSVSSNALSCAAPSFCAIGGSFEDASGSTEALLMTSSGASWTATQVPLPADAAADPQAGITGLSCPSPSFCAAIGRYLNKAGSAEPMVAVWSGGSWTVEQAPVPANGGTNPELTLNSVSCASATSCVADGWYTGDSGAAGALLSWSGKSWTAAQAPLPANINTQDQEAFQGFTGLSCSSSLCAATGWYIDTSGDWQALLLTRSGSSWSVAQAPVPAGAAADPETSIPAISCTASFCSAGGNYDDAAGNIDGLLLAWSGGAWTDKQVPLTADAEADPGVVQVLGMSCVASFCSAYGADNGTSGLQELLELQWTTSQ